MRMFRRFLRGTKGSVIVEFALVVPIFFALVWGIIAFSRAYGRLNCLSAALREGARAGAAQAAPDSTIIALRVARVASAYGCVIEPIDVKVPRISAGDISVGVVDYPLFAGLTFIGVLRNIKVTRWAVFRWEYAPVT